jgi:hypothetical protein
VAEMYNISYELSIKKMKFGMGDRGNGIDQRYNHFVPFWLFKFSRFETAAFMNHAFTAMAS